MFCPLPYCSSDRLHILNDCIWDLGSTFLEWTYTECQSVHAFVLPDDEAAIILKLPFCNTVNIYVAGNGPLRPVSVFHHFLQAMYTRRKGDVDAAAKFRSRLNTRSLHVGWEENIVLYFMKTLLVNALIAWAV